MKILIIDDEPLIRRSLSRVFLSRGHQVIEAQDGEDGMSAWAKEKPQLVLLDILMPRKTGVEVLSQIGSAKTGKVFLMSAHAGTYDTQYVLKLGADGFLQKPFEDIFKVVTFLEERCYEGSK